MITKEIKKNIIHKLGIEDLPLKKAEEVMKKLEDIIERKLVLEILDLLSKEDQKKVLAVIDSSDNKKVSEFLSEKIPAIDSLVKATAESVVKEFKNYIK
jgi:hypothetical protein